LKKKDYEEAEADGTFTDAEYAQVGRDTVDAIKNGKTVWSFILRTIASMKAVTARVREVNTKIH
jgi:hypothetical protein